MRARNIGCGPALIEELRSAGNNVRVLFMSGYTADHSLFRRMLEPGIALLEKPFTPATLLQKLNEIFTAGQGGPT